MIDFEKELTKFDFFDIDENFVGIKGEMTAAIEGFNTVLKRLSKEQNKTNIQIEEMVSILDDNSTSDAVIADLKSALDSCEEEKLSLVQSYITIMDQIEDLYRYALKSENEAWSKQISLLWNSVGASISLQGIIRIDSIHSLFDPRLNLAVGTKSLEDTGEGIILEVLKCGYFYNSNVLRKSEVIVNVLKSKGEDNE